MVKSSSIASKEEKENREKLLNLYRESPLPEEERPSNAALFLKRQELSKILFFNEIYREIKDIHGIIIEFGCRWGQNLITFSNLRGIHEPYNYNRKIIGFDTFEGLFGIQEADGKDPAVHAGNFNVSVGYEDYLSSLLQLHENESPLKHISKNEIIKGNAPEQLKLYLDTNPQTIIALAWFDFDIYKPTKECLELIKPYLAKGSILGFDELNDSKFPGETLALREFANLNSLRIRRNIYSGMQSYVVMK